MGGDDLTEFSRQLGEWVFDGQSYAKLRSVETFDVIAVDCLHTDGRCVETAERSAPK